MGGGDVGGRGYRVVWDGAGRRLAKDDSWEEEEEEEEEEDGEGWVRWGWAEEHEMRLQARVCVCVCVRACVSLWSGVCCSVGT